MQFIATSNRLKKVEMPNTKIKIILAQGKNKDLEAFLFAHPQINLDKTYDIDDIERIPTPRFAVPDFLVVINIDEVEKVKTVTTALTLRNHGHQVFISCFRDANDLITLLTDVHNSFSNTEDKTSPFRTEILITDSATQVLGNISLIVKDFENKHKK